MKIKLSQLKQIIREELSTSLDEGKQVGTLYHYTYYRSLLSIIEGNQLRPSLYGARHKNYPGKREYNAQHDYKDKPYVSLARTPYRTFNHVKGLEGGIVLDGDKLSHKYKIIPYQDPVTFVMNNDHTGTNPKSDEYEERIYSDNGIPNVLDYVKKVIIFGNDKSRVKEVQDFLKEKNYPNIPVEITLGNDFNITKDRFKASKVK